MCSIAEWIFMTLTFDLGLCHGRHDNVLCTAIYLWVNFTWLLCSESSLINDESVKCTETSCSAFLLCFSMNYRDFSVKMIILLFQIVKILLLDFHCLGLLFSPLFYEFSDESLTHRFIFRVLVWNYGNGVNVPRSNCWRHLLCWHNMFSARDIRRSVTDCGIFFCANLLRFIALKAILGYFLGAQLCFHPILCPLNTLNKTKLTRNG